MLNDWCAIATFCDDVRYERGHKHSLIGCYSGDTMIIDNMPSVLPRLCAQVSVILPLHRDPADITVRATLNEDTLGELKIPAREVTEVIDGVRQRANDEGMDYQRISVNAVMMFSPVVVQEDSTLLVEASSEGSSQRIGRLMIRRRVAGDPQF